MLAIASKLSNLLEIASMVFALAIASIEFC